MTKPSDIRLGQHLIQRRLCSLQEVNEGLLSQRKLRTQGAQRPLGWLLIQKGFLDEAELLGALADLGDLELHCPGCRETHGIATYQAGVEYLCPRCRTPLILADHPSPPPEASLPGPAPVPPLAPPERDPDDPMISKVISGCQITERIARGGMGVVYKARQLNLGRTVAIKILSEELAKDRLYVERFVQEARSAAVLSHGNIVHINDVGEHNGIFYFVMEYIDGENLREVLQKQGFLDIRQALQIGLQVTKALQHAHGRGIIHRDIKPENIMITRDGMVKLADLGLAKRVDAGSGITHAGAILGTPFYMPPEQAKDFSRVDERSDIYSLGVTLYKMLTGKVPYDGRSPIEVMIKAIEGKRLRIRDLRPEIPPDVEALVDRMMEKDPERRLQNTGEVIEALEAILAAPAAAALETNSG